MIVLRALLNKMLQKAPSTNPAPTTTPNYDNKNVVDCGSATYKNQGCYKHKKYGGGGVGTRGVAAGVDKEERGKKRGMCASVTQQPCVEDKFIGVLVGLMDLSWNNEELFCRVVMFL